METLLAAMAGAFAGAVHALAGPDHLAAVAPLSARASGARAWRTGALWGAGHAAGVVLLGLLALWARSWLEPSWVSAVGERLVGPCSLAAQPVMLPWQLRNRGQIPGSQPFGFPVIDFLVEGFSHEF